MGSALGMSIAVGLKPRAELLADGGTRALATQGAELHLLLDRELDRMHAARELPRFAGGVGVVIAFGLNHRNGQPRAQPPADLVDLAAAVQPYVIDALERRGVFHRQQLRSLTVAADPIGPTARGITLRVHVADWCA